MPVCSRSLVMLTPPVEAEQGPLALVSEEMRLEKPMHCIEGGARGQGGMAACTLGAKLDCGKRGGLLPAQNLTEKL